MNAEELINILNNSAIEWKWKQDLLLILSDPVFKVELASSENDVSYVLDTSEIQFYTTNKAKAKTFGFQELIQSLKGKSPSEKVVWVNVFGAAWTGRCILSADKKVLIGWAFVESRKGPKLVTPPKWDGSQKTLDEYNRNLT
jgi:hypothetical protein